MRPVTGVINLAPEVRETLDVRRPRVRQAAGGENDMFRGHGLAVGCRHRPGIGAFIEQRPIDAGIELNIRTQVEPVSDMIGVSQNLGLRRVAFAPVPFLLQFIGKRIGILHAFDIAARPGIAVPVPGAPDIATLLINPDRQPDPAQPVQHVHSGKACADHDDIIGFHAGWMASAGYGLHGGHLFALPRISFVLPTNILPAAQKRKRQNGASGLHILPDGMHPRGIAFRSRSAQDQARETRLAFAPPMR